MKKILSVIATVVIILFILAVFGWMVNQIGTKNKKFGFLTKPIEFMYSFPDLFKKSVEEVKSLPGTFIPTPKDFEPINKLEKDLLVLSTYSDTNETRSVVLLNLKNDSVLRKWNFEHPAKKEWIENERIVNPILYPDGSLLYNFYYTRYPGLHMLDAAGNLVWKSDTLVVHHGMNLNKDGDIWACTQIPGWKATGKYFSGGKEVFFNDYTITKFDHLTGEILFHKSITEILKENNISNYLFKSADVKEPIHLNDVQPALKTTQYYNEDDVFISLRNLHLILHYRPSTNELIDVLTGPFINQHDVDIVNDTTLIIFNNNTAVDINRNGKKPHNDTNRAVNAGDFYSNIVSYHLATGEYSFIGDSIFRANKIFTLNEGLVEFIAPETYFVEEQNSGLLWVIKGDEVIYKNVLNSQHDGYHHLPNWTRIVKYE
jgi:hypothetical protein